MLGSLIMITRTVGASNIKISVSVHNACPNNTLAGKQSHLYIWEKRC